MAQTLSSLQQQLATLTQNKFSIPTCDMVSPLSQDIIHTLIPQQANMPQLENYNGKGDPVHHVKTFQILFSDYAHDHSILAKLFAQTFHDKALQWLCSLTPYSINSFPQLANAFIQQFQNNIGLQVSLIDLMHCKQNSKEKLTKFIGRFKHLHAHISYHVPDIYIQHIFIPNLQKDIRDKILLTK